MHKLCFWKIFLVDEMDQNSQSAAREFLLIFLKAADKISESD